MANTDSPNNTAAQTNRAELHLVLSDVLLSYTNSATEFVEVFEDEIQLKINLNDAQGELVLGVEERIIGDIKKDTGKNEGRLQLVNDFKTLTIDIDTDLMMKAWMGDVTIEIENKFSAYIKYRVLSAKVHLQWFEMQGGEAEKQFLSEITKTVKPVEYSEDENYTLRDVEICAEMLGKAIRKIDLRTGGAMVKFNTDHGRLEPVIRILAQQLGYVIKQLTPDEIYELHRQDINASHSIHLMA